jgi:hypothetical protein
MKSELKKRTLKEVSETYRKNLRVNPGYQRGTKWSLPQKQSLTDSLRRGYNLPLFYVLEKEVIWIRDSRKCKNPACGRAVSFGDARIHHIDEHSPGGPTVLVCSEFRPNSFVDPPASITVVCRSVQKRWLHYRHRGSLFSSAANGYIRWLYHSRILTNEEGQLVLSREL